MPGRRTTIRSPSATPPTTVAHRAVDRLGNTEEAGTLRVPAAGGDLAATVTAALPVDSDVRLGSSARIAVRVTGGAGTPTGAVSVRSGTSVLATARLTSGRATLSVPVKALGVGTHALTVGYAGDATHAASQDRVTLRVLKATSTTTASARPVRVTTRQQAVVSVRVGSAVTATGSVRVEVRLGSRVVATRTVRLAGERGRVTLPRLAAGRYRVTATYTGSASVLGSTDATALRVVKAGR